MRLSTSRFIALLPVALLGCGARALAPAAGDASRAGEAEVGAQLPCRFDDPPSRARVALVVAARGGVSFVMTDGSVRQIYQFQPYPPVDGVLFDAGLGHRAGFVLASGRWWGTPAPSACVFDDYHLVCPETDRLALLDLRGRVLWEKEFSGKVSSAGLGLTASLGEGGSVIANVFGRTVLIGPDGAEQAPPAVAPAADAPAAPPAAPAAPAVLTPPDGMRLMTAAGVDHEGAFLGVFRDETMAALFRSVTAAPPWTRVGRALTDVEQVRVEDVAGTYVIDARGTNEFYVPTQKWQPAAAGQEPALDQTSFQLVRPSDGVAVELRPFAYTPVVLTKDGLCAAYREDASGGGQLTVLDVVRGVSAAPITKGGSVPYPIDVWIEDAPSAP